MNNEANSITLTENESESNGILLPVPQQLQNMTLGQLLNDKSVKLDIRGDTMKLSKITNDAVLTIELTQFHAACITKQAKVERYDAKKDYEKTIKQLKKAGMKQKDIAFTLDMSPSYVSQLLKKKSSK